jgi:hypothetical protein
VRALAGAKITAATLACGGGGSRTTASRGMCDSSMTRKLGILFVSMKYVLVSVNLVCIYVKLLKI